MTLLRRPVLLAFVGILLAQAAWMLAVPAYEGIDEFDHAYRAAGAARGEWRLTENAADGRGQFTTVPGGMVAAAREACESLTYTGRDNCTPTDELASGDVRIATAAGSYNPVFYFVIGTVARPFDGAAADYAMRGLCAVLCALGIAVAAWCLGLAGAGLWTRFGLLASLTPVLVYTTIVPAPNGIEIVAGLSLWAGLLLLGSESADDRGQRIGLSVATVSGCVIAVPRMLGPMWLGLVVLVVVVYVGPRRVAAVVRRRPLAFAGSLTAQCLAVAYSSWWTLSAGLTGPSTGSASIATSSGLSSADSVQTLAWILQTVAAFPFRDQPAPIPVYAIVFLVVAGLLVAGLRAGRGRERLAVLAAVVLSLVVPASIGYLTSASQGPIWQGRYGLPLVVGILVMCGLALDRRTWAPVEGPRLVMLGLVLLALAHTWSVWHVAVEFDLVALRLLSALVMLAAWVTFGALVLRRGPA